VELLPLADGHPIQRLAAFPEPMSHHTPVLSKIETHSCGRL
jgi:hypothetical protein